MVKAVELRKGLQNVGLASLERLGHSFCLPPFFAALWFTFIFIYAWYSSFTVKV